MGISCRVLESSLAEESIVRDYAKVGVAEVEEECGSYDMRAGGREK